VLIASCAPPSLNVTLERFEGESGLTFADCGDTIADSNCEEPGDDAQEAAQCLLDAWSTCTPARLSIFYTTIEGDPITSVFYVLPTEDGCGIVRFFDNSQDAYSGDQGITRSTCSSLEPANNCPWLAEDDCTLD
jgi:hypothetical protein